MKPVCLIIGAGAGIGGHVGRRFAREGFHVALCRRTNEDGLDQLVAEIEGEGGAASGYLLNAIEENTIEERIRVIEAKTGPIEVVLYNLGAQIGDRPLEETPLKIFELGWRMGTFGLFRTASAVCPPMARRGRGTLLVTSATAAMRGNAGQHSHAAAMGRPAHALPITERAIRPAWHPHRAHRRRRRGGRPGHPRQDARPRSIPAPARNPRRQGRPAPARQDGRNLLAPPPTAPLSLDPRIGPAPLVHPTLVESLRSSAAGMFIHVQVSCIGLDPACSCAGGVDCLSLPAVSVPPNLRFVFILENPG